MFTCGRCGVAFELKHHLKQHFKRRIPCEVKLADVSYSELLEQLDALPKVTKQKVYDFPCNFCGRKFTQNSNRCRHQKTCKNTSSQPNINNTVINNVTVINNQNNYLIVNNFGFESLDHIANDFIKKCIGNRLDGIETLVKAIHFNDDIPENKNVRRLTKSIKNKLVQVQEHGQWIVKDESDTIKRIIMNSSRLANQYYHNDLEMQERDMGELDMRIHNFLMTISAINHSNYCNLFRRVRALLINAISKY